MSENTSEKTTPNFPTLPNLDRVNDSWNRVGDAVNAATELYLKELTAYLTWTRDVQREVFEQTITTTQELSRLGEHQLAFMARLRDNTPAFGAVPKGTETIAGMVERVVRETARSQ